MDADARASQLLDQVEEVDVSTSWLLEDLHLHLSDDRVVGWVCEVPGDLIAALDRFEGVGPRGQYAREPWYAMAEDRMGVVYQHLHATPADAPRSVDPARPPFTIFTDTKGWFVSDWMGEGGEDLSDLLTGPEPVPMGTVVAQVVDTMSAIDASSKKIVDIIIDM